MEQTNISTHHIEYLEKDFLDIVGKKIDSSILQMYGVGEIKCLKITGITKFWDIHKENAISLRFLMEDVISGLYESAIPIVFGVFGRRDSVEINLGTYDHSDYSTDANLEIIKTSLQSPFQGIEIEQQHPGYLKDIINHFECHSLLTGTPAENEKKEKIELEKIERLIRGLHGRDWGYLVMAHPVENSEINNLFNIVLYENKFIIDSEKSLKLESPIGKRYKQLLNVYLNKLQVAKSAGMWHTTIYLFGSDYETINHVKAIAKSAFGGRRSLPDRIRTLDLTEKITYPGLIINMPPNPPGHFSHPYSLMNTLNSIDLANFIQFPAQEMPGFQIRPYAQFSLSINPTNKETVNIGEILDQGKRMGIPYNIPLENLNKHGLIVGTTGSGKTNTIFYLLKEIWKYNVPFLVIEPAKTEYRKLFSSPELGSALQVFTLGNNNISPFRINPFEIMPGISVQTHIDLLKAVFNASFFMWGPLPQILERCLHEIYVDKGWDLVLNTNSRGVHRNAHPTLTDLYNKIYGVAEKLGYSKETTSEVGGALKTRINSLRIGGKGLMLDTRASIPFHLLMDRPTILELEAIGDDEEKSFMMGLILTMMYENYISKGIFEGNQLRHITVIEEAHRLLAKSSSDNPYTGNAKGKSIETFANILAEFRAYGEGFLIAEQIPSKLASEIVKNTNLKIMHRIVADDDRKIMGATMNIDEKETKKVVSFVPGDAAVFNEGDYKSFHINVPYSKIKSNDSGKDDDLVRNAMENFKEEVQFYTPFDICGKYCSEICKYKSMGEAISTKYRFFSQMPHLVLLLIDNPSSTEPILLQMLEMGKEEGDIVNDQKGVKICSIIHGSERYFEEKGSQYHWSFEDVEDLKDKFLEIYMGALEKFMEPELDFSWELLDQSKIEMFTESYRKLCENKHQTSFCEYICPDQVCLFGFDLSDILDDNEFHETFINIIKSRGDDMFKNLYSLCKEAAKEVLPGGNREAIDRIALCFALQKSLSVKSFNRTTIMMIIGNLIDLISLESSFTDEQMSSG